MKLAARLSLAALLLAPSTARAADWPFVQGTEAPDAPPVHPFGVVQGAADGFVARGVRGLSPELATFEGQRAAFNSASSSKVSSWGFAVRRARAGLRGAMPKTSGHVSYFLLAELGTVSIARDGPTVTDASITVAYLPGAKIRVGQMRMPLMDEGVEGNAIAAEWINPSLPAAGLVLENPVRGGRYDGGSSGFRDVGVEVFDTLQWGHTAVSYALMLSNGRRGVVDTDAAKDVSGRTTVSWVFRGAPSDPHRQELSFFVWGHRGERNLDGVVAQRIRSGVGVHLEKEPFRVRAELVHASGAIFGGPSPSFVGQPLQVDPHGRALGGYVQARVRLGARTLVGLRYDQLDRGLGDAKAARTARSLAPMVELDVVPRVRLQATYERRWLSAPGADADTKRIASTMGDRLSAQLTVVF